MADYPLNHQGLTVLVAEDSPTQAKELSLWLEHQGFTVELAADGRAALEQARRLRPTLIITDIVMPEMDGFQLCQAVKSDPEMQATPVIIVTSLSGWDDITRSLECGADNFLRKPYDFNTLLTRIDYILLNRSLRSSCKLRAGVEVELRGKRLFINSEREQILDLLISTYEEVMQMNQVLQAQQVEVARANQILRELYQIALNTTRAESAQSICEGALRHSARLPAARPTWVLLNGEGGDMLRLGAACACGQEPACPCIKAAADARALEPMIVRCPCQPAAADGSCGALIVVPLRVQARQVGVLACAAAATAPGPDEVDVLGSIGQHLSVALERVELLERLRLRAQQLEDANQELESFSYSVSHDLRAPLRTISGFSELLLEHLGKGLDAEGRRLLDVIRGSCERMDALILGLLELSRLSRVSITEVDIDMGRMASDVLDELCATREDLDLDIGVLPPAAGDPVLIRQVWSNLISNALKYSSGRARRRIEIDGHQEGQRNVYSVRDNGAGFDMAHCDRLFGVFQRLHRSDEFSGIGIGLANVRRIIGRHGGTVWAEAEVDRGARFFFSLPLQDSVRMSDSKGF